MHDTSQKRRPGEQSRKEHYREMSATVCHSKAVAKGFPTSDRHHLRPCRGFVITEVGGNFANQEEHCSHCSLTFPSSNDKLGETRIVRRHKTLPRKKKRKFRIGVFVVGFQQNSWVAILLIRIALNFWLKIEWPRVVEKIYIYTNIYRIQQPHCLLTTIALLLL